MKRFLLLGCLALFTSCASYKHYNHHHANLRDPEKLKLDIDFAYEKLKKLHPRLYWYTPKEILDYKFDSLKATIREPMTSRDFYFIMGPLIASIRQGHTFVHPLSACKEKEKFGISYMKGLPPIYMFEYEVFDDKVIITRSVNDRVYVEPGTEVVSINKVPVSELISKHKKSIPSDGFITTFVDHKIGSGFPELCYLENDMDAKVEFELKFKDSTQYLVLEREKKRLTSKKFKTKQQRASEKPERKIEQKRKETQGYLWLTDRYSKQLNFSDADSSIALLKINDFSLGDYAKFYREAFVLIDSLKCNELILDLRDNHGGDARDAMELYSYLTDSTIGFIQKAEVTEKMSVFHANYFAGNPLWINLIFALFLPKEILSRTLITLMITHGEDGQYYMHYPGMHKVYPKENRFKGPVYAIINGGTFSAACTLASHLHGSKRAIIVGEETGGAYNGTIAGLMKTIILPESGLHITFGLSAIETPYHTENEGRGVIPDVEIRPLPIDRINGRDREMEWILEDIHIRRKQQRVVQQPLDNAYSRK